MANPRNQLVRDQILTKAAEVFEKRGFGQSRIQDIADALALSRSALYHYFDSKDEILAALVDEYTGERIAGFESIARDTNRPARDRMNEALRRSISSRLSSGPRMRVLDQIVSEMPEELRRKLNNDRRRVLDYYAAIVFLPSTGIFRSLYVTSVDDTLYYFTYDGEIYTHDDTGWSSISMPAAAVQKL